MSEFQGLLVVVAVAFAAPFVLGLVPRLLLPSAVVEIVVGVVVGPSVLGWVVIDQAVGVVALIGLAFVLFLAGLEIDFTKLRGPVVRATIAGFLLSFGLAAAAGFGLSAAGLVQTPLLVAIILSTTALGVLVPVLKDVGEASSGFGQLVIAAGATADFGAILLLTLFFSGESGIGSALVLFGSLLLLVVAVYAAIRSAQRSRSVRANLLRLQDTTAQIRVRGAMVLLIGFAALAEELGLEAILGAFAAGVILSLVDRDDVMSHPDFRPKLESIGFGVFIPVFFVSTGVAFDLDALLADASTVAMVPIFLAALLAVRGLPAILYWRAIAGRRVVVAALLQATSLPFVIAATAIGSELGLIGPAESAALISAGLISVLTFPAIGLSLLRRTTSPAGGSRRVEPAIPMPQS